MISAFKSLVDGDSFDYNLHIATERQASKRKKGINEAYFTSVYLHTVIDHLREIVAENPDLTTPEINTILFKEIDDYAKTVYENAYVFGEYLDYVCCQYLSTDADKYQEISQKLIESDKDFESLGFSDCTNFDEYLMLYTYRRKRELFKEIFEGYDSGIPSTPDNFKNFDILLQYHMKDASKGYFTEWFSLPEVADVLSSSLPLAKKKAKIKEFASWYKNPVDKKNFELYSNVFLRGSFAYIAHDESITSQDIRKDLARATSRTVEQLDKLGHLDNYMTDFVYEMSRMQYPELANIICDSGFPDKNFVNSVVTMSEELTVLEKSRNETTDPEYRSQLSSQISYYKRALGRKKDEIRPHLLKDKVKTPLGENYLFSASKNFSVESLLALNSFWANRYVKELDLYSQTMYCVHKFGLVDKVKSDKPTLVPENDIAEALIQMDTFYPLASSFLEHKQRTVSEERSDDEQEYEDGDVEEKIIRFSYEPFIKDVAEKFGKDAYAEHFSGVLPDQPHDIEDDANWYIRLYNPVFSSYLMKNEMLNVLLLSLGNSSTENFPNAGIILEDFSGKSTESLDGTKAFIPYYPVIGIDAGLSFPVRIHADKNVLKDFLKSFNGDALIPIYEGADDFHHPYKNNAPISANLILPPTDKIRTLYKKNISKNEIEDITSTNYHPHGRFVSHLAFSSPKRVPVHLQSSVPTSKKAKSTMVRRYIDLDTNEILQLCNGDFVPVTPKSNGKSGQGDDGFDR